MEKQSKVTKVMAIAGTVVFWLPLLAPLVFGLFALFQRGRFLFDYLMPAELAFVVLGGGLLLIWAALRVRSRRKLIGWGLAAAVALLFGFQAVAVVTGLASGETEMGGWQWDIVLVMVAGYWLALIAVGVGGILLIRDLYRNKPVPAA